MNKSLGNGTKKFLENAKKILNSRGARLTYTVIIIIVILLSLTYGIMSITGQFKDKCPKDQSPQGPDQKCFKDECQQKTDDTCQDEIIGSKLQWDTANRPDCPDCGCDDGYSIVNNLNNEDTRTCVKMCGNTKFPPDGKKQDDYVCAYVNRPKDGDNDDNEYLEYIPVGQVCSKINLDGKETDVTFNGIPLSCQNPNICKMDEKDKGFCFDTRPPSGNSCPPGQHSFCSINKVGAPCGKGKCEGITLLNDDGKPLATYCNDNVSDGKLCCDPDLMTLTDNIGTKGCCKTGETPVNVETPGNESTKGCCPKGQTINSNGICCGEGETGTDSGECCDPDRVITRKDNTTFCCKSSELNLQPIVISSGRRICSNVGKGIPFNAKRSECSNTKETFNDSNIFNNNYISMNDNDSPFNNNYSPFNNNYSENAYDNYGKENFGSPLKGGDCQFKNSQNDPNINLVCEDDKCRLACGNYDPKIKNNYALNNADNYDYCENVNCSFDGNLIYTPNKSDGRVICTDGKGYNYWKHQNPEDLRFTITGNMKDENCTAQDCFNVFDRIGGSIKKVDYSKIVSDKKQCRLTSTCDASTLSDFGSLKGIKIANIYNLNGTITEKGSDCLTNRGSCKYLNSGRFCKHGSLDGENCLTEDQENISSCPKAPNENIGFPNNIQCQQPSEENPSRKFFCTPTNKLGVSVSGFGEGCCNFGNIVKNDNVSCQEGYFTKFGSWAPIYKPWNDSNWNEGKDLRVLNTGVNGTWDGVPSRNLIILKNKKTGMYLNTNSKGHLCETDGDAYLYLYYVNNAQTNTKFDNGTYTVKFAGKQGISPHSFLAGPADKLGQIKGVVSNNTQDTSKKGDIGFLTVDNGNSKSGRDYPIRLVINQNDPNKCVLAAFHISNNDGDTPRFLQNGLNDAQSADNNYIRLGRVVDNNEIRFNIYWNTGDKRNSISNDFSYPKRSLKGGTGPGHEFYDLSASAEYEIVAALREDMDDFMVNQFRGKLPSGPIIKDPYSIKQFVTGSHQIRDIIHVLINNIQPSAI